MPTNSASTTVGSVNTLKELLGELREHFPDWKTAGEDEAQLEHSNRHVAAWQYGEMVLRFETLFEFGTALMVEVTGMSLPIKGTRERLICTERLPLSISAHDQAARLQEKSITPYQELFNTHTWSPKAQSGMCELARPLIHGIDIQLLNKEGDDPLKLEEILLPRYFGHTEFGKLLEDGTVKADPDRPGKYLYPLGGSYVTAEHMMNVALDVPPRCNPSKILFGSIYDWAAVPALEFLLASIDDPRCSLTMLTRPTIAGAALYGALVQWAESGYEVSLEEEV